MDWLRRARKLCSSLRWNDGVIKETAISDIKIYAMVEPMIFSCYIVLRCNEITTNYIIIMVFNDYCAIFLLERVKGGGFYGISGKS